MNIVITLAKKFWRFAIDTIFPRRCVHCGKHNPDSQYNYICNVCAKNIYIIKGGRCLRCGAILGTNTSPNSVFCYKCKEAAPAFNWSLSCCLFKGAARDLIIELKYKKALYVLNDIQKIIISNPNAEAFLHDAILVPVPLHNSRKAKRGFNQSEIISKAARRAFPSSGIKLCNLLTRTRRTQTQTKLSKEERSQNIKGAFSINPNLAGKIAKSSHIIIVDDVMTSGATMSECAKELKRNGYKNIDVFSFARKM